MVEGENATMADDVKISKFGKIKGPRTQKPNNDANQQIAGNILKLILFLKKLFDINLILCLSQQLSKLSATS
jgi:hypothetical protein